MTGLEIQGVAPFRDQFKAARGGLPGAGLAWAEALRDDAFAGFARRGLPGPKIEAWRYTSLAAVAKSPPPPLAEAGAVGRDEIEAALGGDIDGPRVVVVDGRPGPELSDLGGLAEGLTVTGWEQFLAEEPELAAQFMATPDRDDQALEALNGALFGGGVILRLAPGCGSDRPLHVVHVASPAAAGSAIHSRNLILAGADSRVTVVESFISLGAARMWTNTVMRIDVGPGARVAHYRLQAEAGGALHTAATTAHLARGGQFDGLTLATGAATSRHETVVVHAGPGSRSTVTGMTLAADGRRAEILNRIDHESPDCTSRQLHRGVVDGTSRSVFQGRVVVHPDAQRSDARQSSRNLLLAKGAEAITKPELEIHADDVLCAHGATVGELDANMLFYLRSRGLDEAAARALLIDGFIAELIDPIAIPELRAYFRRAAQNWRRAGQAQVEAA